MTIAQTPATPSADLDTVLGALRREFDVLERLLAALARPRWDGATACSEWDITKLISHLCSGADLHLRAIRTAVEGAEPASQAVREQVWAHFDSLSPEQMLPAFRESVTAYLNYLEGVPAERQSARVKSFAGEIPLASFAQFRLAEMSLHSWDVRVTLDPTTRLLPESARVHLPVALGIMNRRANAEQRTAQRGSRYALDVYGPVAHRFDLVVGDDGVVAEQPSGNAPAMLRLSAEAFIRLVNGRFPLEQAERDGEVVIEGDRPTALRLNALFPGF